MIHEVDLHGRPYLFDNALEAIRFAIKWGGFLVTPFPFNAP